MDPNEPADQTLAARAAEGDEKAIRMIVERYERPVFSLHYRMVRDRELAEDLSQETFIRAFNAIHTYNPRYKLSSWLFKIANNLAIDHLRKRTLDTVSIDGAPDALTESERAQTSYDIPSEEESPEEYAANRELGEQIEAAIAKLRPHYRVATVLRHVEGYSYEEIAGIMDLPLGTVKTYIHRARLELRELLAHLDPSK